MVKKGSSRTAWQKRTGLKGIGSLKQGLLKKVGYSVSASKTRRHAAVKRAVKKYGRASTIRKLNAVAVYTRRRSPMTSRTFRSDMKFAQKMKGGNELGTASQIESAIGKVDEKQLNISANKGYSKTDPALVRAPDKLRKEVQKLGVSVERGAKLGDVRNALEAAHDKAMNRPAPADE